MPEQPSQRRDPPGADREGDVLVVRGAGQRPGEIPGVGAHCHPARLPRRRGQGGQRAAQQVRRGRARVIGAIAPRSAASTVSASDQAATCGRPTRWPYGFRPRRVSSDS